MFPDSAQADTDTDPVAVWCFDEGTGTTAEDSASGNTGTLQGGAGWAPGVFGTALDLDGVNDWVEVTGFSGTSPTDGLTVAAWVKFPAAGGFHSSMSSMHEMARTITSTSTPISLSFRFRVPPG